MFSFKTFFGAEVAVLEKIGSQGGTIQWHPPGGVSPVSRGKKTEKKTTDFFISNRTRDVCNQNTENFRENHDFDAIEWFRFFFISM